VETMESFWYFGGNHGPPTEKIHRGLILILISGGLILILIRWVDIDFPKPEQTVLKEAEEEEEVIILHFLCDNSSVCDNSAFV